MVESVSTQVEKWRSEECVHIRGECVTQVEKWGVCHTGGEVCVCVCVWGECVHTCGGGGSVCVCVSVLCGCGGVGGVSTHVERWGVCVCVCVCVCACMFWGYTPLPAPHVCQS